MLAAYLLPETELDLDEIRAHAASLLPDYMVPNAFAALDEIPLTPAGKLDKRALPAATRIAAGGYRAPATATGGACAKSSPNYSAKTASAPTTRSSSWAATRCWRRG